jgi:hypothetical protein
MNRFRPKPPPLSVPRLGSLRYRLLHAPGAKDASPGYLDQLMIFLEEPPPGAHDRWKQGADLCAAWGVPTTAPSVWRLYRSHALEWRLHLAHEAGRADGISLEVLAEKAEELVALRTFELLANPNSPPACLASLARIACRRKALELDRLKYMDNRMRSLLSVATQVRRNQTGSQPPTPPAQK